MAVVIIVLIVAFICACFRCLHNELEKTRYVSTAAIADDSK